MPSEAFREERAEVAAKLDAAIRRFLADAGIPAENDRGEYVFGEHAIGTHPDTREMRFFLEDLAAFTPELIARIRTEVLADFPRWKIVPQYHERTFTASAKTVEFDDRPARGTVTADTPAYRDWWRASVAFDEETFGPYRRMFRWVTRQVPGLLPRVAKEKVVPVAGVRHSRDAGGGASVWLLTGPKVEGVFRDKTGPSDSFAVTADGRVHPRFCRDFEPYSDRDPTAWLRHYGRAKAGAEEEFRTGRGAKIATLRIAEYLTDEDLKTRLTGAR